MKTNYITIYSHDCSKAFTIYFEGFFDLNDVVKETKMKNMIICFSTSIDIIENGSSFLEYNIYYDKYKNWREESDKWMSMKNYDITEQKFLELFKPLEYNAQFDSLLEN